MRLLAPTPRAALPRHASALAVLQGTRGVLQRGWLQHEQRRVRDAGGGTGPGGTGEVLAACLVGAVGEAARWHDPGPCAAGPALDALWLALVDDRWGPRANGVGPVPPPAVRLARARDLARWNDAPGRTREEVLALVDLALDRVAAAWRDSADARRGERAPQGRSGVPSAALS